MCGCFRVVPMLSFRADVSVFYSYFRAVHAIFCVVLMFSRVALIFFGVAQRWLRMFSPEELQMILSGSEKPIDVDVSHAHLAECPHCHVVCISLYMHSPLSSFLYLSFP